MPVQYRTDFERGAPPHLTQAPPAVLKELETVRSLSHRNVLGLAAAWPGYGVLAYEWSDGGSLRDQKLSMGDVLKALVHVAWGLHYLHSRGVVHGDVKGDNVMIAGGVCKIGDLASLRRLLRRVSENKPVDIISTRSAPETVTWAAPEQQGGAEVPGFETRVDIYQLANLLLEMIVAETISGERWSEKGVERAAREAEVVGLGGLVKQMLSQKPWEGPTAEEVAKRAAAGWKRRYG
jgi:serine/threonine protein kinase